MYAELASATNFSFLRGASHPEELVQAASWLGHSAIGIADRNSLAGVVRAHLAAKSEGLKLLVGSHLCLEGDIECLVYPQNRAAYARLCRLLTEGKLAAPKGECMLREDDLLAAGEGQLLLCIPPDDLDAEAAPSSRTPARNSGSGYASCHPADHVGTAASNAPTALPESGSGTSTTARSPSNSSFHASLTTNFSPTSSDRMLRSPTNPQRAPCHPGDRLVLPVPILRAGSPADPIEKVGVKCIRGA